MLDFISESGILFTSKPSAIFRVLKRGNSAIQFIELVERSFTERSRIVLGLDTSMQTALSKGRALCFLPALDSLHQSKSIEVIK